MAFDQVGLRAIWAEAGGNVVVARAARVKPVLQRRTPTAVSEHAAVPHPFERGHFVIAGTAPGLQGQVGIGADRNWQDVVLLPSSRRRCKAFGRRQLVAGVKGRRVAACATLTLEDFPAARGDGIELVGIRRWLQRVNVECQRIELFIAVTAADLVGIGQFAEAGKVGWNEPGVIRQVVRALVKRSVAHHVHQGTMLLEACAVEVAPVLHPDQVGHLNGTKETRTMPADHAGRNPVVYCGDLLRRHLLNPGMRIRPQPGRAEQGPFQGVNFLHLEAARAEGVSPRCIKTKVALRTFKRRAVR
jgi:hypothetical protein